jgi:hypothetical protein
MENDPTAFIYSGATTLNEEQVKVIKEHIALINQNTDLVYVPIIPC